MICGYKKKKDKNKILVEVLYDDAWICSMQLFMAFLPSEIAFIISNV